MAIIIYDATQFSLVVLMLMTMFLLYMGYGIQGERGGWMLIFASLFSMSLFIALVAAFSGVWWIISPGLGAAFFVIVMRDGILKAFYKSNENKK